MFDVCDGCGYIFTENDILHHYNNGTELYCTHCVEKYFHTVPSNADIVEETVHDLAKRVA